MKIKYTGETDGYLEHGVIYEVVDQFPDGCEVSVFTEYGGIIYVDSSESEVIEE